MKAETLIEMMEQPEYQVLTAGEFACIVRRSGIMDEEQDEGFPLFSEESIRLQKQKEDRERHADYSDRVAGDE